jgi:hypothetical protein
MDYHKYGVNVKVYNPLPSVEGQDKLSDEQLNAIYLGVQGSFWSFVQSKTRENWDSECWIEGRSGGYAVFDTGDYDPPDDWKDMVRETKDYYVNVVWVKEVEANIEELNNMDIYDAADAVQANIGQPIAIVRTINDNQYIAIAYRENHWGGEDKAYSTHRVNHWGCESGNYDMSFSEALHDLNDRVQYG